MKILMKKPESAKRGNPTAIRAGLPMITLGRRLPGRLMERTIFWVNKTSQQIQARAFNALKPLGMDPRHYVVLLLLEEAGPISQQEMSLDLNIDPTIMVAIVDDLERLGLARRDVHPRDRRAYAVKLTPKGGRMLERATKIMDGVEKDFFRVLSEAERAELVTILRRLHESAQTGSPEVAHDHKDLKGAAQ